ncbi:hypothetical protein ES332_D11G197900v1 [Gossypium tomentosum]|uniref:Uncharacterized protein n=1 Tax=Gossypium tomentosum TaxID=34277 RepID=A0A5D2IPJ8_GOSTO|nr:hypothetical protein ES332_D11G197900v1 [Gossypium tomentosum]
MRITRERTKNGGLDRFLWFGMRKVLSILSRFLFFNNQTFNSGYCPHFCLSEGTAEVGY